MSEHHPVSGATPLLVTCDPQVCEEEPISSPFAAHLLGQVGGPHDPLGVTGIHNCYRSVAFRDWVAKPGSGGVKRA